MLNEGPTGLVPAGAASSAEASKDPLPAGYSDRGPGGTARQSVVLSTYGPVPVARILTVAFVMSLHLLLFAPPRAMLFRLFVSSSGVMFAPQAMNGASAA